MRERVIPVNQNVKRLRDFQLGVFLKSKELRGSVILCTEKIKDDKRNDDIWELLCNSEENERNIKSSLTTE